MKKFSSIPLPASTENRVGYINAPKTNMSVVEAADYLGIGQRKLRELYYKGDIRAAKIGTRLIFPRGELDRFISEALS